MKVILTENVKALGNVGEIVNVSEGYARNYLIPNKSGILADAGNKKILENQKKKIAKKVNEAKAQALSLKSKIDGLTLEFVKRIAGSGKIFGTISSTELAKELEAKEITVEKRMIIIANPIKNLGTFNVTVKLFEGVDAAFKVKVELDPIQAEELKKAQAKAEAKKKATPAESEEAKAAEFEESVETTTEEEA